MTRSPKLTFVSDRPCVRCRGVDRYVGSKRCVACHLARNKRRYAEKPEAWLEYNRNRNHERRRSSYLKHRFGIDLTEYNRILAEQGGVCAICGDHCRTGNRLAVDHDHTTGLVRGLLCMPCNAALGHLKDSPELLRSAAAYLETHTKSGVIPLSTATNRTR